MTNTALALRGDFDPAIIPDFMNYAKEIAKTDFVPAALRNRPEAVLACFMTGHELGIKPMQSLRQIYNYDGKVGLAAELMRAMILDQGHRIWPGEGQEYTTSRVVFYGERADNNDRARVEWTIDMARSAGIANKPNWKLSPRAMLGARASMELARVLFPDIVAGMAYSKEELEDGLIVDAEILDADEETSTPGTVKRTATKPKRTKKATAPAAAPTTHSPPPAPGLPDDEIQDAEIVEEPVDTQTEEEKIRSVQIVKLGKALGVDHHPIVNAVTSGVTSSARQLTGEQASEVMNIIRAVNDGRARVFENPNGPNGIEWIDQTSEAPPVPLDEDVTPSPAESSSVSEADDDVVDAELVEDEEELEDDDEEEDDPETWDADRWRGYLSAKGVKVIQVIRHAAQTTPQGKTPVGNLQGIAGSGRAAELKKWIDGGAQG